jgi:hypothetical protein
MNMSRVATLCCVIALAVTMALRAESRQAASTPKGSTQTLNGLEISVRSLDRAPSASLNDCPPGTNREKGLTKQGEEFAVVTVSFKVTPSSKTSTLKRPTVHDSAGNTYYTAVSFVDVGRTPEFSCAFPFRVPSGTALKSLEIGDATFDLTAVPGAKP